MPLISVIIPVYNVDKYLSKCVDSVLQQQFKDLEVILVDDGSPDSCPLICDAYVTQHDNITVIHKENGGLSDARNTGVKQAKGDYIIFLDSDDYWNDIGMLLKAHQCIDTYLNPDVILFEAKKYFEATEKFIDDRKLDVSFINRSSTKETIKYLISSKTYSMSACTKIINRKFFMDNDLFFTKGLLGEDLDWFMHLALVANHFRAIESINYVYRIRSGSITQSINKKNIDDEIWILDKWCPLIENNKDLGEYKKYYFGVLAYAYVIDLLMVGKLAKKERRETANRLIKYDYLLQYDVNKEIKITRIVYKLAGMRFTTKLLNKYYCIRNWIKSI